MKLTAAAAAVIAWVLLMGMFHRLQGDFEEMGELCGAVSEPGADSLEDLPVFGDGCTHGPCSCPEGAECPEDPQQCTCVDGTVRRNHWHHSPECARGEGHGDSCFLSILCEGRPDTESPLPDVIAAEISRQTGRPVPPSTPGVNGQPREDGLPYSAAQRRIEVLERRIAELEHPPVRSIQEIRNRFQDCGDHLRALLAEREGLEDELAACQGL